MSHYCVENASTDDLPIIYELFEQAIAFQKANDYVGWQNFDKAFIRSDVKNSLLYKIIREEEVVGIFCVCFSDFLIWREREQGDAIYLHRIILNQQFKGVKLFRHVLDWALDFAKGRRLKYLRMDTWAENFKIINYYKSYGFVFVENYTTADTEELPVQHRNLKVALLEYHIQT
jgi:ribosomal protein S18 acetylase RimI-like enzyme